MSNISKLNHFSPLRLAVLIFDNEITHQKPLHCYGISLNPLPQHYISNYVTTCMLSCVL